MHDVRGYESGMVVGKERDHLGHFFWLDDVEQIRAALHMLSYRVCDPASAAPAAGIEGPLRAFRRGRDAPVSWTRCPGQ